MAAPAPEPGVVRKEVLLVCSDALEDDQLLAGTLVAVGFRVRRAADAERLTATVAARRPDAVVITPAIGGVIPLVTSLSQLGAEREIPVAVAVSDPRRPGLYVVLWLRPAGWEVQEVALAELVESLSQAAGGIGAAGLDDRVEVAGLEMRRSTGVAYLDGDLLELSPKEFDLLWALASRPGRLHSLDDLLKEVWSEASGDGLTSIPVHIFSLRQKLGPEGSVSIANVRGHGYRLDVCAPGY